MKLPLIWRILAPTLAVSLLLLAVGLIAAVYAYRWNDRVSLLLDKRVAAVLATQELVLTIRDIRHALSRYDLTTDPEYLALAKASISESRDMINRLSIAPIEEDQAQLSEILEELKQIDSQVADITDVANPNTEAIRAMISSKALANAQNMLDRLQTAVALESRQNRLNADRIGMSLAILGLCGAGAGLLAGFGVARGISRSIEQLGGSVRSVAETIFEKGESAPTSPDGIHDLLTTIGNIRQKTAGIMDELEQTREKATRSDQLAAVGQLAAGIAHELRNPLTAVKLLVDDAVEQETTLGIQELLVLKDEVNHMEQMTQSFLDFARPPKLTRRPTNLNQLIEQCVELVKRRCEMLHIQIIVEGNAGQVMGDPQQLRQVILNLLINAIDAQPNGGRITVRSTEDWSAGSCEIEIVDAGKGISEEYYDRIFDPFISSKETGMGLGLTISRRIVRSHGGDLLALNSNHCVSSEQVSPVDGAAFCIQLPLQMVSEGVDRG